MSAIFVFIRRLLSIVLLLLIILMLTMVPQYLEPIDIVSLIILSVLILLSGLIAYKAWPKRQLLKTKITPEPDSNMLLEPVIESSFVPTLVNKVEQMDSLDMKIANNVSSEVEEISVSATINEPDKKSNFKIFSSFVVGTKYDGRKQLLKELINKLKDIEFYEKYEGLTNSEILEEYPARDESNPVWEITDEVLPFATIETEPDNPYDKNAVAVFIGESENHTFKVGYLPKEDAEVISPVLMNSDNFYVTAYIKGGKRKFIDYDDYGDEKIRIRNKDYMLDLKIVFL